jgi:hypothetical protein
VTVVVPVPPALDRRNADPTTTLSGLPVTVNGGAAVKVNEAVPVCVPLVAITAHVPGSAAVREEPSTAHPVLVVE